MTKKRSSSKGLNQSFDNLCEPVVDGLKVFVLTEGSHMCFWYQEEACNTKSKQCSNLDSPYCICPIKPKG
jgi:hypothetical protein